MTSPFPEGVTPSTGDNLERTAIKLLSVLNGSTLTAAGFASLDLSLLPTSDPGGGKPWRNGGLMQVGP